MKAAAAVVAVVVVVAGRLEGDGKIRLAQASVSVSMCVCVVRKFSQIECKETFLMVSVVCYLPGQRNIFLLLLPASPRLLRHPSARTHLAVWSSTISPPPPLPPAASLSSSTQICLVVVVGYKYTSDCVCQLSHFATTRQPAPP